MSAIRTEVEVIAFHRMDKASTVRARPAPAGDSCVAVGGLVYAYDRKTWVFRGIKEAYLKELLNRGFTGIGQVLAIGEADARLIQRNLHASLGKPSLQVTGMCGGMVARKLRLYLRYVGTWGTPFGAPGVLPTPPLYDDDLGRQVNTRGWVMKRIVYSSPQAVAPTLRAPAPGTPAADSPPRPRPASRSRSTDLVPIREIANAPVLPPEQSLGARRVGSGLFRGFGNSRSGGATIAVDAVRDARGWTPLAEPTARSEAILAETHVRTEAHPTVKMQLRPPTGARAARVSMEPAGPRASEGAPTNYRGDA